MVAVADSNTIYLSTNGAKLFGSPHSEVLWEGGVGTGKTFQLGVYLAVLCRFYPGIRILLLRQTRISLNNSVLETLEEEVLGQGHPACTPLRARNSRQAYTWPSARNVVDGIVYDGASRIDLGGMDNPERFMSTQYDVIAFVEATEGLAGAWAKLSTRTRRYYVTRFGRPWSLQIADCNPAGARHWLNLRAEQKVDVPEDVRIKMGMSKDEARGMSAMHRIRTHIKDNPKFWNADLEDWTEQGAAYMVTLSKLPPEQRAALLDGLWTDRTGQVYPTFNHDRHVVNGKLVYRKGDYRKWFLVPVGAPIFGTTPVMEPDFEERHVAYFIIGADWGFLPDPGVVKLYAVDDAQRSFVVREWMLTEKPLQWWAELIIGLQKEFDGMVRAIVTDGPQERVTTLNEMLGGKLNDRGQAIAMKANKGPGSIDSGIETMRFALDDDSTGQPRARYFANALQHDPDPYLLEHHAPTDGVKEFPSYVYHERRDDSKTASNKPLPIDKDNHGMDTDRYAYAYLFGNTHSGVKPPAEVYDPLVIDLDAPPPTYDDDEDDY